MMSMLHVLMLLAGVPLGLFLKHKGAKRGEGNPQPVSPYRTPAACRDDLPIPSRWSFPAMPGWLWPAAAVLLILSCSAAQRAHRPWDQNAHIAINASAHALVLLDDTLSAMAAHDGATGMDAVHLHAKYDVAARAEQEALADLVLAEHAVDLAVATGAASDRCRAAVIAGDAQQALADLRGALQPLGVAMPQDVTVGVPALASIVVEASGNCRDGGTP